MVLTIQPLELRAPYKARWAWAPYKAPLKPGDCLPLVDQRLVPEKSAGKKATGKRVEKKGVGFCFMSIGHKEPGGVCAEVSKRSHLVVWGSVVYVKIKQ